jgi:hypothetical protein
LAYDTRVNDGNVISQPISKLLYPTVGSKRNISMSRTRTDQRQTWCDVDAKVAQSVGANSGRALTPIAKTIRRALDAEHRFEIALRIDEPTIALSRRQRS